jgi:protocatechuate 3,4-dioxygenase beta subunit
MSDNVDDRKPAVLGRQRALTSLSAMGLRKREGRRAAAATCEAAPSNPVRNEVARQNLGAKVIIGSQAFDRSDITEGTPGIPLTLTLTVVEEASARAPIVGAHVEVWHCDADGVYSAYALGACGGSPATTYLRGVQTTDDAGRVTFKTIYPGWYDARATHIHVQIYNGTTLKKTMELGFPDAINSAVHGTILYIKGESPTRNFDDPVFSNAPGNGTYGGRHEFQMVAIAGDNAGGYFATAPIAIRRFD